MDITSAIDALKQKFGQSVTDTVEFRGEHTLILTRDALKEALAYCKEELAFDYLVDISSVDNSGEDPRFEMVYELYSYEHLISLRVKAPVPEDDCEVESVFDIWATADWHEREAYDMMGIKFKGHPNLKRILMWEGYPYFPLRKEFPLAGKPSEMPDVAFSKEAPLAGGPFVTSPTESGTIAREPRAKG